jgi:cytosine deaminase
MLVLSRQRDQSVMIDDHIEVRVVDVRGDKVRLGFIAPRDVTVHRKEVYDEIRRENQAAAQLKPEDLQGLKPPPAPQMRLVPSPPPPEILTKDDEACLRAAIDEAKASLAEGGVPIGAVLARGGTVLARGRDRTRQNGDATAHAEVECLRAAGPGNAFADATLYSTLLPCFLCSGAVVELGIKRVVIGDSVNYAGNSRPGGTCGDFLRAHGVELIDARDLECIELLGRFIRENPDGWKK